MFDAYIPYVLASNQNFPVQYENIVPLPVMVASKYPDRTSYPLQFSGLLPSENPDIPGSEQNFEHHAAEATVQNPSGIDFDVPSNVNITSLTDDSEMSMECHTECDTLDQDLAHVDEQLVITQLVETDRTVSEQDDKENSQSASSSRYTPTIHTLESAFAADPAGLAGSLVSLPECWTSVHELVKVADQLRPDRTPQEYTEEEICNMKKAVIYFHISRCYLEASYLYAVILAWNYSRDLQDRWTSFSYVLCYAGVAYTDAHLSIVSCLLLTELENISQSSSESVQ
jgi:hypothetical protein